MLALFHSPAGAFLQPWGKRAEEDEDERKGFRVSAACGMTTYRVEVLFAHKRCQFFRTIMGWERRFELTRRWGAAALVGAAAAAVAAASRVTRVENCMLAGFVGLERGSL